MVVKERLKIVLKFMLQFSNVSLSTSTICKTRKAIGLISQTL